MELYIIMDMVGVVLYFLTLARALGLYGAKVSWIYDELVLLYGVVLPS